MSPPGGTGKAGLCGGMLAAVTRPVLLRVVRFGLGFALKTTRWKIDIDPAARALLLDPKRTGVLVSFWHESLLLSVATWWWAAPRNPALRLHILISRNRDGRAIADIVAHWRARAIHGSSTSKGKDKGGALALRQLREMLKLGELVAITPDGPKGPRHTIQPGVVVLAEVTGAPVIPIGLMCDGIRANSWDRMLIPMPFGQGRLVFGAPVRKEMDGQAGLARRLAEGMDSVNRVAGHVLGPAAYTELVAPPPPLIPASAGDDGHEISKSPMDFRAAGQIEGAVWGALATLVAPALIVMLRWRIRRGKELSPRVRERMGLGSCAKARETGTRTGLVWIHAASVGEVISVLPVIRTLLDGDEASVRVPIVLVTTATLTGFRTLAAAMPDAMAAGRVIHQFVPLDVPRWVNRFLRQWKPGALLLTESELWPNLIGACGRHGVPVAIMNGRLSAAALAGWRHIPALAARMLASVTWIAARSPDDAARFRMLGGRAVFCGGDLKLSAEPLAYDPALLERLRLIVDKRPVWLAASTHDGEDESIFSAAALLRDTFPDLLTIVVPRHPERGEQVAKLAALMLPAPVFRGQEGAPRRSLGAWPEPGEPVWVVDTLGELGTLFRLARVVFMGNSLFEAGRLRAKGGGHNPLEPARLGCAIATGPAIANFEATYARFGDAVRVVDSARALAGWLRPLLVDPSNAWAAGEAARLAAEHGAGLPDRLAHLIKATVTGAGPRERGALIQDIERQAVGVGPA